MDRGLSGVVEELCSLKMPVTILVSDSAVLADIKDQFVPEEDDHVVVALDEGLMLTKQGRNFGFINLKVPPVFCALEGIDHFIERRFIWSVFSRVFAG